MEDKAMQQRNKRKTRRNKRKQGETGRSVLLAMIGTNVIDQRHYLFL